MEGEVMIEAMLTTYDNPYDPFDDYDLWYAWDLKAGYGTASMLARIAVVSDETSDADQARAIELAIDELVELNVTGMFRKVTRETAS
jgi:hypothetical protein